MLISPSSLGDLYSGFSTAFNKGLNNTASHYSKVAMTVPSAASEEKYTWLTDMPGIREWLGSRIVNDLSAARYVVVNKDYENTISVPRNKIEDDQYSTYGVIFEHMGFNVAQHPDKLVFGLLKKGFATKCFDDQYFFDADHRGYDAAGAEVSVSNMVDGAGLPWFLLDCSQPVKPLIYQERKKFKFVSITGDQSANVFFDKEFIYGVDGRSNAGYGLWQLAYGSKADLTSANFVAGRTAMASQRNKAGDSLGIRPTHLVVPPELEEQARAILNAELINGGESNVWSGSAELIVTPFVA